MELSAEFIQENGLSVEQVTAITTEATAQETTLKGEMIALGTTNAEGILNGVAGQVEALTGIKREHGEKFKPYLEKASNLFFEGEKTSLERQKAELADKIKNGAGDATLKAELETTKVALDELKKKEAKFADWEENDYKGLLETTKQELSKTNLRVAFNSVKPVFPAEANTFEVKAKWREAQKAIEEKYDIELDENSEPWGISKENKFLKIKLSDLIAKDEAITALTQGRSQKGPGAVTKSKIKLEGVPFDIPENATRAEGQAAIREYLAGLNIPVLSDAYAKKFAELNQKILEEKPAK